MTDLDPEIWENKTLGAAAQNENLDRLTAQELEDAAAKKEGREPREIVHDNTYPDWTPEVSERTGTVPSNYQTVHFADEQQADIPVDSRPEDETAAGLDENVDEENQEPNPVESDEVVTSPEGPSEGESTSTPPAEEGGSTQWTT